MYPPGEISPIVLELTNRLRITLLEAAAIVADSRNTSMLSICMNSGFNTRYASRNTRHPDSTIPRHVCYQRTRTSDPRTKRGTRSIHLHSSRLRHNICLGFFLHSRDSNAYWNNAGTMIWRPLFQTLRAAYVTRTVRKKRCYGILKAPLACT
jgi:hypothetical protein